MRIAANIEAHRSAPDVSLDRYVKSRVVELGQSLDGRAAVYLDIKFWIILRKAAAGLATEESHIELLRMLRKLTAAGQVFCSISESIFMELMKHGDGTSRLQTARLIDELSLGVSLIAYNMRVATELAHFIQSHGNNRDSLHPLRHLVWSKLVYVLGFVHPTSLPFDAATGLAVQKAFFDEMWVMSLAAMVAQIGDAMPPGGSNFDELAGNLNEGIARHAAELRSFAQAYDAELRGVVDACGDMIIQIVSDTAERAIGSSPPHGSDEWMKSQGQWKSAIFQALKKGSAKEQLRSMHIGASLHAAFRWDKPRRFEGNDIYDFQHASAALAHCRAFFTEHPLRSVIMANHVALDRLYDCRVISDVREAVEHLKRFAQG